ncbi:MAG: peptidoglycan-binding protein [Bacillota bacterium]
MLRSILLILTPLALLLCPAPGHTESTYPCCPLHCQEDRVLSLQTPPITGVDVEVLQIELRDAGYFKEAIDGIFGQTTRQAVKTFQEARGLVPNGIVDEGTWQALGDVLELPVTAEKIPDPPPGRVSVLIDTIQRKLTILSDGRPFKQYPVAVGKYSTPSPIGAWKITSKAMNWGTGFGTRWNGLSVPWGVYGIHGTNKPGSIGSYASHGCIRMFNRHVEEIYPWVSSGTPVVIVGNPFKYEPEAFRDLCRGSRGSDVMVAQRVLKRMGYYTGPIDGIWGWGMEQAVIKYRKDKGLRHGNKVDREVYEKLGIL